MAITTFYDNSNNSSNVNIIGDFSSNVFPYDASNITMVRIGNTVTRLLEGLFSDATSLTSVKFVSDSSLNTIDANVFNNCSNLTTIIIPYSVTSIGNNSFSGSGISNNTIHIQNGNTIDISYNKLSDFYGATNVFVRRSLVFTDASSGWGWFGNMTKQRLSEAKIDWGLDDYDIRRLYKISDIYPIVNNLDLSGNNWSNINLYSGNNPLLEPYTSYWAYSIKKQNI